MNPSRLLFVAILGVLAAACTNPQPPPPTVRPVQLVRVTLGGGADSAVFAGEIRPRHEADLGFRIAGKLVARYVDVGARVKKGQQLARLDPADVTLQADAQRAAVAAAETEYRFAKAEYERYQNLYQQKFISESALDQKKNALASNQAKFEQQKAQLAVTRNQASYATLVADQDGVITAVNAETGQVVGAGQSVLRLAREDQREVAIAVPENRVGELKSAKEIAVVLWADPGKFHPGRVREISPAVDPATRTFAARVTLIDNDRAAQWGMTANVVLREPAAPNEAVLPLTSIYHLPDGKPAVWIYDAKAQTVDLRPVTIGQIREDGIVVSAGLKGGEWVVSAGVNKLLPGQHVRPYEGGATPSVAAGG